MNAQSFFPNRTFDLSVHPDVLATLQSPRSAAPDFASSDFTAVELRLPVSRSASLLFVDTGVEAYQTLLDGVAPETDVYLLNPAQDAIAQITEVLAGRSQVASLQIVSHGDIGRLQLGQAELSLNTLPTYASQLQSWVTALTDDADILLYGCNVAEGELGQAFVRILSQLTQADIAASTDITGKHGNWTLEFQQGAIAAELPFSANSLKQYDHDLLGSDFDNNGTRDLVWYNYQTGALELRLFNGTTEINTINLGSVGNGWQLVDLADFDNNGYADLVWHNQSTGDSAVWTMNGTGIAGCAMLPSTGPGTDWRITGVKDFDLNGTPDLLWRSSFGGGVAIWTMTGTAVTGCQMLPSVSAPWVISGVADANNDGSVDILWRNPNSGENAFWLMNQTNLASAIILPNRPSPWVIHELADWNGDGSVDLLWRNFSTGEVSIWSLNNGNFTANINVATPAGLPWTILDARDLDSNGTPDLIVRNYLTGQNAFWMMNGTTYTNEVANYTAPGWLDVMAL